MRGCTPLAVTAPGAGRTSAGPGVDHGKNQHLQHARHQEGGPCNPHQALRPHIGSVSWCCLGSLGAATGGLSAWLVLHGGGRMVAGLEGRCQAFLRRHQGLVDLNALAVVILATTGSGREIASHSVTKPATITMAGPAITSHTWPNFHQGTGTAGVAMAGFEDMVLYSSTISVKVRP